MSKISDLALETAETAEQVSTAAAAISAEPDASVEEVILAAQLGAASQQLARTARRIHDTLRTS